jgi:hypothetical protein
MVAVIYRTWVKARRGRHFHATVDTPVFGDEVKTACGRTLRVDLWKPDAERPMNAWRCYECDVQLGLAR